MEFLEIFSWVIMGFNLRWGSSDPERWFHISHEINKTLTSNQFSPPSLPTQKNGNGKTNLVKNENNQRGSNLAKISRKVANFFWIFLLKMGEGKK